MEKTTKSKSRILSFIPKTATVSFHNHPFSPRRDKRPDNTGTGGAKSFSGPIIRKIPSEARIKSSSGRNYDAQEPTSPKISCMGTIKHKKNKSKSKITIKAPMTPQLQSRKEHNKPKHQSSFKWNLFRGSSASKKDMEVKSARSAREEDDVPDTFAVKAPGLSQMKRFASSRDTLADFDWKRSLEDNDDEDEDDDVIIPHSAPMMIGGGNRIVCEPKKEVNLWKRRTLDPPKPLRVNGKM